MIERYSSDEMSSIWSEDNKVAKWLDVERAVIEILEKEEITPKGLSKQLKEVSITHNEVLEREAVTNHDLAAFVDVLQSKIQKDSNWIHYGLTSSDVVDTANALLIKESLNIVVEKIAELVNSLKNKAISESDTLIIGRTHGVYAEPTTLGSIFGNWCLEVSRGLDRLSSSLEIISYGKISGVVGNHSLISESLGIALRKVNPFEINSHEMFSLNLLPRSNQLKINRKSLVLGKTCLAFASFFVFITLAHLLPFKIPQILANTNRINEIKTFNEDIESKTNILNGYGAKVSQLQSKTENIIGLGSNILTTATVYQELNEKTPENVRFVSLKVSDKDQIIIAGVAKDDQSVVEMMNNLTTLNSVTETKIETLIGLSEEDRIALYTTEGEAAPKLEDLPQETISKKFTISLKLNSVEGEKFDDKKIYAELVKRTKKK